MPQPALETRDRDEAEDASAGALERYAVSLREAEAAALRDQELQEGLREAFTETAAARAGVRLWAGELYRRQGHDPRLALLPALLDARDPQAVLRGLGEVQRVADRYSSSYDRLVREQRRLEALQRRAASRASAARTTAVQAQVDRAVAVAVVEAAEARLAAARAQQPVLVAPPARAATTGGDCAGGSLAGYPNGRLPLEALCALPGTGGLLLRADAAASFVRLSSAFAADLGRPLCVSDAYRDLAGQVAVAAAKPHLAAVPGRSNHGWGVALDLCGGVQQFDTPQHQWLVEHAAAFGWYHPGWADRGGSRPEPWHWEFSG